MVIKITTKDGKEEEYHDAKNLYIHNGYVEFWAARPNNSEPFQKIRIVKHFLFLKFFDVSMEENETDF